MTRDDEVQDRNDMETMLRELDGAYERQDLNEGQAVLDRIYALLDRERLPDPW